MSLGLVAAGLVALTVGGELALRGAVGLAMRLGVSTAIIGLTVVGFGTSAPELMVSIQASLAGTPDIAVGNVVGSNIANILLILGVGAAITVLTCSAGVVRRDATATMAASILLVVLSWRGVIEGWHGALMFGALILYMGWSYHMDRKDMASANLHEREAEETEGAPNAPLLIVAYILIGLVGLVGGAHLLVQGAVDIAREFGVPETVIGLTLIAIGTSLPELAATVVAAMRNHVDVAIGNVLGSCLFNILMIIGVTAMIKPLSVAADIRAIDMWVMLGATAALLVILRRDHKVSRVEAGLLLAAYVIYITMMAFRLDVM